MGNYVGLRTGPRWILFQMDQLTPEAAQEIFCHGVIVWIALAGYALLDSVGFQPLPKGPGSTLGAPITVKAQALGQRPFLLFCCSIFLPLFFSILRLTFLSLNSGMGATWAEASLPVNAPQKCRIPKP